MSVLPKIEGGTRVHWLLLVSLALNLFFVGAAGAVAYRYTSPVPLAPVARIDNNLVGRLNRVADTLPPDDADAMRAQLRDDAVKIATAQADLRLSQDDVRRSLRADPFDADAMRGRHGGQSRRARAVRPGRPRHAGGGGEQDVDRRPQQARRLAGGARQRPDGAVSRCFLAHDLIRKPVPHFSGSCSRRRCAGRLRRSPIARARRWCRRAPAGAANPAPRRRARPSSRRAAWRSMP